MDTTSFLLGLAAGGITALLLNKNRDYLIIKKLNKIMATQAEAAVQLDTVTTKLGKVLTEIQALKDAAAAAANVSPELQAAIDRVVGAAEAADNANPDAPIEPPVEEPTV